jgi:hypothetical protein
MLLPTLWSLHTSAHTHMHAHTQNATFKQNHNRMEKTSVNRLLPFKQTNLIYSERLEHITVIGCSHPASYSRRTAGYSGV